MQDIIVLGGGMTGAAMALGLAKQGMNVAIIEKSPLPDFTQSAPYDIRISAINVASVSLLEKLGAWQAIAQMRAYPYKGLETWEIDGFSTTFHAADLGLDKLGYMVENRVIQQALWAELTNYPNYTQVLGFSQISANQSEEIWTITLDQQRSFSAPLMIACDGANSMARQWAGIGLTTWQYRQHCLLATVETEFADQDTTWQQFFPSGPRAFLPLAGHQGCIVWYDSPERIHALRQMPLSSLSEEIHRYFPARLGKVSVKQVGRFPLIRQHAQQYARNGIVLVGDAAHTINPLAGQGVNLGFKDVEVLLELLGKAHQKAGRDAYHNALRLYEQRRKPDNLLMQSTMDLFYKAFKTDLLPLKIARNLALIAAERAGFMKKKALQYALGMALR